MTCLDDRLVPKSLSDFTHGMSPLRGQVQSLPCCAFKPAQASRPAPEWKRAPKRAMLQARRFLKPNKAQVALACSSKSMESPSKLKWTGMPSSIKTSGFRPLQTPAKAPSISETIRDFTSGTSRVSGRSCQCQTPCRKDAGAVSLPWEPHNVRGPFVNEPTI